MITEDSVGWYQRQVVIEIERDLEGRQHDCQKLAPERPMVVRGAQLVHGVGRLQLVD